MTASPSRPRLPQTVREMQPHAERAAQLLRSLANEQRLMLLCNLLEGPLSVSELNERVPLSQFVGRFECSRVGVTEVSGAEFVRACEVMAGEIELGEARECSAQGEADCRFDFGLVGEAAFDALGSREENVADTHVDPEFLGRRCGLVLPRRASGRGRRWYRQER